MEISSDEDQAEPRSVTGREPAGNRSAPGREPDQVDHGPATLDSSILPADMTANKPLFNKVSKIINSHTSNAGGAGGGPVGMSGTLVCKDAFAVLATLLSVRPHGESSETPILLDCGVGDGRMLYLAASLLHPRPIRLLGVDICEPSMLNGDLLGGLGGFLSNKKGIKEMAKVRVDFFHAIFTPQETYDNAKAKAKAVAPPPRVKSLAGVTHVMAMWEGWDPKDQHELLRLVCLADSIVAMCFVQASAGKKRIDLHKLKWATVTGEVQVRLAVGGTTLTAYWLKRTSTHSQTRPPTRQDLESLLMWDTWKRPDKMLTRSRAVFDKP
jgi:hypothetical protein